MSGKPLTEAERAVLQRALQIVGEAASPQAPAEPPAESAAARTHSTSKFSLLASVHRPIGSISYYAACVACVLIGCECAPVLMMLYCRCRYISRCLPPGCLLLEDR